ncbi:MAG: hypothetical protein ACK42L_06965 [Thermoanaerobaculum sp.]
MVALVTAMVAAQPAYALSGYCITTDDGCNWRVYCEWTINGHTVKISLQGYPC